MIVIARTSARVGLDGVVHRVRRGSTLAHADHPIVRENPDLWKPLPVDFDVEPAPAPAPAVVAEVVPSPKDVRAWAAEAGVEVPARGKLPDDVIAAYQAARNDG